MTNTSKAKGSRFEARIRDYLHDQGAPHAERLPAGAQADRGDLTGTPGVVWECKDHKRIELAGWCDELVTEMRHANAEIGAVVHHRKGMGNPAMDYATLPLFVYCRLLRDAGYLDGTR